MSESESLDMKPSIILLNMSIIVLTAAVITLVHNGLGDLSSRSALAISVGIAWIGYSTMRYTAEKFG